MDFKITEAQKGLYLDHLTQVYNRVFLFEKIKPQINEKHPFTLFMIDFDNFKNINDSFGHLAGDKTLVLVSQGIKNIIPKDAVLIRYAGDEFIVVLETPDIDRVKSIAEDILNSIRVLDIDFNNTKINQTLSIGISFYPGESNDLNQLIGNADAALYLSKKRGKNNYAFYNEISIEQMSLKIGLNYFPCSKIINHENIIEELKDMSETNVFGGMLLTGSSGIGKSRIINAVKEHVKKETLFDINPLQKDCLMPFSSLRNGISAYIKKLLALEDVDISLLSDLSNENKKILDFFINPENNFNLLLNNCTTDLINSALLSFFDCIVNKYSKLSIIIDNFQFIDLKSLNFLKMLMESSYSRNVKFYATVLSPLPENINNPEALTKTITEISNIPKIISHEIHPLTKENTREMIDFIFPGLGDNLNFSADIFEISNGQPFFIEELLKLLLVKNFIFHEDGGWNIRDNYQDKIPKTLTEVIRQRLITLDPEIKETILISSLLGETISPELISRINSSNENDVLEILSKANKQKILREDNNTFSFFNPAAKDTALNELSADKKDELFSLASDALLDSYTDNLEEISFQLANIFKNNNDLTRLNSLSQIISKNASNILNSEEILAYLEDISFKRKKAAHTIKIKELSLEDRDLILGFLRHFQAAVNYSGLYPSNNKLRIQIVEDIFKLLELLLSKYSSIEISEVDKNLVVNQIRLTDYYTKGLDLSSITTSFIERNIKTVTFYNGINLEELRNFISVICLNPDEISKIGEWQAIISKNKLTNISINQAVYISEEKSRFAPIKNKIEGAIISDFLLGKLSGK
ncbi:MAG: diguanylate cyclase, partial [Candidatus Omnitrophota bacterium]